MESYSGCDTVISRMFRGIDNCYAKTFKKTYSKLNIHIHFDQKHIDHFFQFRDMFRTKNNFEIPHHKKTMHNPHHLSIHTSKDFC